MLEFRMAPPKQRAGLITREELLDRLERADVPVVALVAPAGYGKTTLLSQFFESTTRRAAWLSLDEGHDDPLLLWSDLSHSLSRSGILRDSSNLALDSGSVLTRGVDRLLESMSPGSNALLILDHVDHVGAHPALDVIGALLTKARGHLQILLASRSARSLPLTLLRTRGDLIELTMEDLAFDQSEIEAVLGAIGLGNPDAVEAVVRTTEGWPAAVYLTALAMKSGAPSPSDGGVHGNDTFLVDYLRQELMKDVSEAVESFLLRSSVLPRMSGELCDYVLETEDSALTLEWLAEQNLMVVPLDRTRQWYRYHSLLQEYLQAECMRELGTAAKGLNRRASVWFEDNGYVALAIEQARVAGDDDRVANLLGTSARSFYATGRYTVLAEWFSWLEERGTLHDHPELAAIGAFSRALGGDPGGSERLSLIAYDHPDGRPREERDLGPLTLMWRAYQAQRGVEAALEDARSAHEVLGHQPEWAHSSLGAVALATCAVEGVEVAESIWADALWRGDSMGAAPLTSVARAMRALAAIRRSAWEEAETHLKAAIGGIEESGLERYVTSCLAYVAAARVAAHRRDLEEARQHLSAAAAIRPLLTFALPVYSVLTLHEMALSYVELADIAGARRVMRDAADILVLRPRLGILVDEHDNLKERLSALPAGTVGPSSLTPAELRLLPLLVTHLTYPEIGDRLYVSKHTVKTQAMSIYRKLGVSSRSEAVERARHIGLISS